MINPIRVRFAWHALLFSDATEPLDMESAKWSSEGKAVAHSIFERHGRGAEARCAATVLEAAGLGFELHSHDQDFWPLGLLRREDKAPRPGQGHRHDGHGRRSAVRRRPYCPR